MWAVKSFKFGYRWKIGNGKGQIMGRYNILGVALPL
jgi:hypothetical protein